MDDAKGINRADCNDLSGATKPGRSLVVLAVGLVAAAACLPLDPVVARLISGVKLRGDVRRELEFVQQFGAVTSCVLIATAVLLLDPRAKTLLPRALLALVTNAAAVFALKSLIGRARPRLGEPYHFGGPWSTFDVPLGDGGVATLHAWEFWKRGVADLWSLPSNHTASAFALAGVLSRMYPRLRPLVVTLAAVVGVCRVLFGAHYVSDVVVGGTIGWVISSVVMGWGPRAK